MSRGNPPSGPLPPSTSPPKLRRAGAFSAEGMKRELARDTFIRQATLFSLLALLLWGSLKQGDAAGVEGALGRLLLWGTVVGAWVALGVAGARAATRLAGLGAWMERDPAAAESEIAELLGKWGLHRWIRVGLYHRLALLRHRAGRFAESAAVSTALLELGLSGVRVPVVRRAEPWPAEGPEASATTLQDADSLRVGLLLLAAEATLQVGDLPACWRWLGELHRVELPLPAVLQRLAIQTRYELAAGHHAASMHQVEQKVRLAELMPAGACGMMHALLAVAAGRTGQVALAHWLERRARLLLAQLEPSGPIVTDPVGVA